ncbi:hypothetical protein HMI55_002368, partial [Coelomomyces lativittatus]
YHDYLLRFDGQGHYDFTKLENHEPSSSLSRALPPPFHEPFGSGRGVVTPTEVFPKTVTSSSTTPTPSHHPK